MIDLLTSAIRQTAGKREVDHRPWPLPGRPWRMGQTWEHLLFAHWALPSAALATHMPEQLPLDTRDGCAWLGVTPFLLKALRPIAGAPLPVLSTFPEVNVRTYVTVGGKPGIFFLSLDAASALAVAGARHFYRLPYFLADMEMDYDGDEVSYRSRRRDARGHRAELELRYGPVSDPRESGAGLARALRHGALLPLHARRGEAGRPCRDPPPALAAPGCRRGDRQKHDTAAPANAARGWAPAPLRETAGRPHLGPRARLAPRPAARGGRGRRPSKSRLRARP